MFTYRVVCCAPAALRHVRVARKTSKGRSKVAARGGGEYKRGTGASAPAATSSPRPHAPTLASVEPRVPRRKGAGERVSEWARAAAAAAGAAVVSKQHGVLLLLQDVCVRGGGRG